MGYQSWSSKPELQSQPSFPGRSKPGSGVQTPDTHPQNNNGPAPTPTTPHKSHSCSPDKENQAQKRQPSSQNWKQERLRSTPGNTSTEKESGIQRGDPQSVHDSSTHSGQRGTSPGVHQLMEKRNEFLTLATNRDVTGDYAQARLKK